MAVASVDIAWIAVWDAIHALVAGIAEFEKTFQGWKSPPNEFPCAFTIAGWVDLGPVNTGGSHYYIYIPVYVFAHEESGSLVASMKKAMELAGDVQAAVVADRELGLAYCEVVESPKWEAMPRDVPVGYERQCVKVTFQARIFLDNL